MKEPEDGYWWAQHVGGCETMELVYVCTSEDGFRWVAVFNEHRYYSFDEFRFIKRWEPLDDMDAHNAYLTKIKHLEEIIDDQKDHLHVHSVKMHRMKKKIQEYEKTSGSQAMRDLEKIHSLCLLLHGTQMPDSVFETLNKIEELATD